MIVAVAGLVIFTAYEILLSYHTNRVFGPLFRLQKTVKRMADGEEPSPIRLRDGDHFNELVDDFNRMVAVKSPKK